jgi:hypothetical protein
MFGSQGAISMPTMDINFDRPLVTIHFARIGKPERSYQEGFIDDDGI